MQQGFAAAPGGFHNPSNSTPPSTAATGTAITANKSTHLNGGRFDFDDGGSYCGGWEDGKAHGHGVCTGPKGQGAYCGSWHYGFEVSGVYTWPSGSLYEGQWQNGKRHGLGIENRGRWMYRGEWTQGFKGRYGVRQSTTSSAKYEGTWANGLQDGYGSETYADSGTYQGQWLRGMRHGYGVRASAPFGLASHYRPKPTLRASLSSLRSAEANSSSAPAGLDAVAAAAERDRRIDDSRGGFVLKARSDEPPQRRRSLVEKSLKKSLLSGWKIRKQRSTGDLEKRMTSGGSLRSTASSASWMSNESSQSGPNGGSFHTDSNASFVVEDEHMDANVTETYMGEWKNDKRSGYGISERTDGLRYEGEWFNNKKYGYGVTIHRDGSREEGKYKNNVLITSQKKKHLFLVRSAKFRERIEAAISAAQRASKIALQKADIAISRMATARGKAEMADTAAYQAQEDFKVARLAANQFAPDFTLSNLDKIQLRDLSKFKTSPEERGRNARVENALADSQPTTANPPLPPRGQTPQPYQHRASLGQFQPKSAYAQRSDSPANRQSPFQRPAAGASAAESAPGGGARFGSSSYASPPPHQTEPIHSRNTPAYDDSPSHPLPQQRHHPPPPRHQQQLQPSGADSNPPYARLNSRQSRASVLDEVTQPPLPSKMANHVAKASNSWYTTVPTSSSSYSSHSPPANSISGQRGGDNRNGYRASADFGSPSSQTPPPPSHSAHTADRSAYASRIDVLDSNESAYQRNAALRRNSKPVSGDSPHSYKQAMSDHFDHYQRPPSRDSSVDRYTRAASRLSGNSRQPSVDRNKPLAEPIPAPDHSRGSSVLRSTTPAMNPGTGNGSVIGAAAAIAATNLQNRLLPAANSSAAAGAPPSGHGFPVPPFEDFILRKRSLGQEIVPSPVGQPKRTESLYVGAAAKKESHTKNTPLAAQIQRKKSMPDFQVLPNATSGMSREEVSVLSSARREEMRRLQEENERLRANPLLYLVSPHVKEWFSRQQLLLLVLFVNISLAIVFYKLLTS